MGANLACVGKSQNNQRDVPQEIIAADATASGIFWATTTSSRVSPAARRTYTTTDGKHTISSKNRVQLNIFHRLEDYFLSVQKKAAAGASDNNNAALALPTSDVCVITLAESLSRGDLFGVASMPARFYLLFRQKEARAQLRRQQKKSNIATSSSSSPLRGLFVDAFFFLRDGSHAEVEC